MLVSDIKKTLENRNDRGAWNKGVTEYALELLEHIEEYQGGNYELNPTNARKELLNGADDWSQYSFGGCSLIYDPEIAKRLCTDAELKKTHNGEHNPNQNEQWLDTQARALYQACERILEIINK